MKTIEELYKAILADNDLKAQCVEAVKANKLDEFLKAQGCDATVEDVKAFLESKKEVTPDELDTTAGGCNMDEALISVFGLGLGCVIAAIQSAVTKEADFGPGGVMCPEKKPDCVSTSNMN